MSFSECCGKPVGNHSVNDHGGGMRFRNGIPFSTWQERYIDWFRDLGFLNPPGTETKAAREVAAYVKKAGS